MYIERNLIYTHNFKMFLADLFCISYWTDGRGAWYVAWTLPVYLFYPLYYHLVSKAKKYRWTLSGTGLVIITLVCTFLEMNQNATLIRFASPIGAAIAFLIGDAFADLVKSNRKKCASDPLYRIFDCAVVPFGYSVRRYCICMVLCIMRHFIVCFMWYIVRDYAGYCCKKIYWTMRLCFPCNLLV